MHTVVIVNPYEGLVYDELTVYDYTEDNNDYTDDNSYDSYEYDTEYREPEAPVPYTPFIFRR